MEEHGADELDDDDRFGLQVFLTQTFVLFDGLRFCLSIHLDEVLQQQDRCEDLAESADKGCQVDLCSLHRRGATVGGHFLRLQEGILHVCCEG